MERLSASKNEFCFSHQYMCITNKYSISSSGGGSIVSILSAKFRGNNIITALILII